MRVYISGVHSDPDPSPGLGLARSLKQSFPQSTLVAVDHSASSTGLHSPIFDETFVQAIWSELNLDSYATLVESLLSDPETCWISGLDVELDWLAKTVEGHGRLLVPPPSALGAVRKPVIRIAPDLGMRVPSWLPAVSEPAAIHRLGRHSGWRLWIKGVYHEAYPAFSFSEVMTQIERLERLWPLEEIFVQAHVPGLERGYTFAAYKGRVLGAVEVVKRSLTSQGKTWAASVSPLAPDALEALTAVVARLEWTGGGEIEFVRAEDGQDWLIDFNPRFPAYIHGVTLCGPNLPALLVGAALNRQPLPSSPSNKQFVRVIEEIPCRQDLLLSALVPGGGDQRAVSKHPSHQSELAKRIARKATKRRTVAGVSHVGLSIGDILPLASTAERTPVRIRDHEAFRAVAARVSDAIARCDDLPVLTPALSVKTDPHAEIGQMAGEAGWWAEAISADEIRWAVRAGFEPSRIVCNGPSVASVGRDVHSRVAAAFADSCEALEQVVSGDFADIVGVRLRLPSIRSRFGVDLAEYSRFTAVAQSLKSLGQERPYGLHFHFASDVCGPRRWFELLDEALEWSRALSVVSGKGPSVFDMGGGWHHEDFHEFFLTRLPELQAKIRHALPSVRRVLFEPGKAVLATSAMLVSRVIEVRPADGDNLEIVVDASLADLPMAPLYSHPMLLIGANGAGGWLTGGTSRILGSICMETDILARGVSFPRPPSVDDKIVFLDAGGYDASMAWAFARGASRDDRTE